MKYNRFFPILAIALILPLLALTMLATPALAAPTITLSPVSGAAGTSVTVSGNNFQSYASDKVHIYFDGEEIANSPIAVLSNGEFKVSFTVPDTTTPGAAYVTVRDKDGHQLGESASFVVPKTGIKLNIEGGVVGTTVTVAGTGFHAGGTVTFYYADRTTTELGAAVATPTGECTYSFNIPDSTAGAHIITAKDLTDSQAEAVFSVIPSIVLSPVSGAINDKVTVTGTGFGYKSQVVIDFGNQPVATGKTGDNGSFETTFKVPGVKLQAYNVEAKDGEGNMAEAAFTIAGGTVPFIFPQWGIYAIMGVGGLVLFFFGFWLGRKYAYTY